MLDAPCSVAEDFELLDAIAAAGVLLEKRGEREALLRFLVETIAKGRDPGISVRMRAHGLALVLDILRAWGREFVAWTFHNMIGDVSVVNWDELRDKVGADADDGGRGAESEGANDAGVGVGDSSDKDAEEAKSEADNSSGERVVVAEGEDREKVLDGVVVAGGEAAENSSGEGVLTSADVFVTELAAYCALALLLTSSEFGDESGEELDDCRLTFSQVVDFQFYQLLLKRGWKQLFVLPEVFYAVGPEFVLGWLRAVVEADKELERQREQCKEKMEDREKAPATEEHADAEADKKPHLDKIVGANVPGSSADVNPGVGGSAGSGGKAARLPTASTLAASVKRRSAGVDASESSKVVGALGSSAGANATGRSTGVNSLAIDAKLSVIVEDVPVDQRTTVNLNFGHELLKAPSGPGSSRAAMVGLLKSCKSIPHVPEKSYPGTDQLHPFCSYRYLKPNDRVVRCHRCTPAGGRAHPDGSDDGPLIGLFPTSGDADGQHDGSPRAARRLGRPAKKLRECSACYTINRFSDHDHDHEVQFEDIVLANQLRRLIVIVLRGLALLSVGEKRIPEEKKEENEVVVEEKDLGLLVVETIVGIVDEDILSSDNHPSDTGDCFPYYLDMFGVLATSGPVHVAAAAVDGLFVLFKSQLLDKRDMEETIRKVSATYVRTFLMPPPSQHYSLHKQREGGGHMEREGGS